MDRVIRLFEVSDGVIELPSEQNLRYIERLAREFKVFSEVVSKDEAVVVSCASSSLVMMVAEDV